MVLGTLSLLFALLVVPARAGCDHPTTSVEVAVALEQAELAYKRTDKLAVLEMEGTASTLVSCLGEELDPHLAARVHRVRALRFFLEKNPDAVKTSFAAARSLEPGYQLPDTLAPQGHPLQVWYREVPVEEATWVPVEPPPGLRFQFDGRNGSRRVPTWPTLLQVFDDQGAVILTRWVSPGEPVPDLSGLAPPPPLPVASPSLPSAVLVPDPPLPAWVGHGSWGLAAGAGASAVASLVTWGLASRTASVYGDAEDPEALLQRNHALLVTTAVTAPLALGLGAGAVVLARW